MPERATGGQAIWFAPPAGRLVVEPLDTLIAVFDRASGQTHLLAAPLPEILECLADGPVALDGLLDRLAVRFDLSAEGDAAQVVAARLEELAALGLVERR